MIDEIKNSISVNLPETSNLSQFKFYLFYFNIMFYVEILFLSKNDWLFKIIENKEGDNRKFD